MLLALVGSFFYLAYEKVAYHPLPDPYRKIIIFKEMEGDGQEEAQLVSSMGGQVLKSLPIVNGIVACFTGPNAVKALRRREDILCVEDDFYINSKKKTAGMLSTGTADLSAGIKDPSVSGKAVVKVAVIDSGVDIDHPDLLPFLGEGFNTIYPYEEPNDILGHGTHVTGIISNTAGKISGGSPDLKIYPVKVFNRYCLAYLSDVIDGLQWCQKEGIDIINMSFGTSRYSPTLEKAIKVLYDSGIILVAAAGNLGPKPGTVLYPAKFMETIAVSASDGHGNIAWFSSRGEEVLFIVPGVRIQSTWKQGRYSRESGTSMSTPQVAAAVAAILSTRGRLRQNEVVETLKEFSEDLGLPMEYQGFGRIDFGLLKETLEI